MDKQDVLRVMGIPERELVAVDEVDEGTVVTTHDGQRTLIVDGAVAGLYEEPPAPDEGETEQGPHIRFDLAAVPDGSAADVLAWVDDDADRAQRALEVEAGKEKPRSSLVAQLEKLVS